MFFFVALISIISNAVNINGDHSWYSFDIQEHEICTGFAGLSYTSPCSQYYPNLGPQDPSTYCVHEYVACCCAHCLECHPEATPEPTAEPTTLEPTLATLEPTLEPTAKETPTTTLASTIEDDNNLLVVDTEGGKPANAASDSGSISVSTEILLGFVFVSFWILCCGGFWLYYKSSNKQNKSVEKYTPYIPERKVESHTIEKISITVGSEYAIANEADSSVINMNELAAEGTGATPGSTPEGTADTPGEGYAQTGARPPTRSLEPAGLFLNAAAVDRSRTNTNQTVSTIGSIGTLHDSYFPDEEDDTSMDLYEDTFQTLEHEGPVPSGSNQCRSPPRMSEGGMVTGFDAQNMMRNNVVDKVFDEYDLSFNAVVEKKKQAHMVLDPQLSPIQSSVPLVY